MPITATQREKRRARLGSSDTPAILGCDPWKTAADVYYSKIAVPMVGEPDLDADDDTSSVATLGQILENAIIDHGSELLGIPLIKNQYRVAENKIHAANLDAIGRDVPEIVEIKTTGLKGRIPASEADQWGEKDSGDVPFRVIAQVQHQLYCAGPEYKRAHVVAWVGFRGIVPYHIDRHDELIEIIRNKGEIFWKENVGKKIPPTEEPPNLDFLKRIAREKGKIVRWGMDMDKLVNEWLDAVEFTKIQKSIAAAAEKRKEYWDAKVFHALGDAEGAELWNGNEIQVKSSKRKGYTVQDHLVVQLKFGENKDKGDETSGVSA